MKGRNPIYGVFGLVAMLGGLLWAEGGSLSPSDQPQTGTIDSTGQPNRQAGTINATTGNTNTAVSPAGTDPTFSPANRNPVNDDNFRAGAPGTSEQGQSFGFSDPRLAPGHNAETLGTAAPAVNTSQPGTAPITPGLGASTGQPGSPGIVSAPAGNPGPVGLPGIQNTAPTTGNVGTGGSGASGIPGAISNSGTHGLEGSGH